MKDFAIGLGVILGIAGLIGLLTGLVCVVLGAASGNKRTLRAGSYTLLYSSLGLLVSFTLCSVSA